MRAGRVERAAVVRDGSYAPAGPAEVLGAPAELLGWPGVTLPELTLLGTALAPVVVLDRGAHRVRAAAGRGPERDPDVLAVWEWPESAAPPAPLRLTGVLVRARESWRPALAAAGRWRGFGPAAVVDDDPTAPDDLRRLEHQVRGVGLVAGGRCAVPAEAGRRAPARRRTADRWVEETLYGHALATGVLDG